jgi:cyclohexanecarboxylate-CoA ligase
VSEAPASGLISDRLFEIAARDPGRELVYDPLFGRFSYADVAAQVERLAFGLRHLGLGRGDIVILQLPNWAPFLVFHIALTAIGATTVTIPIVYRERELAGVIRLTGARALVVPRDWHRFDYAAMAGRLRDTVDGLDRVFLVGGDTGTAVPEGMTGYEALMAEPWEQRTTERLESLKPALDDMTALGFTSGTTGDLKGAVYDTRILRATNMGFIERYGLDRNDRIFGCSPLGHAVGFTHALRMTLTIGGSIVLLERWDPERALRLIRDEKCTFMAAATPFLLDLVYHPKLRDYGSLETVRLFLCGGASIPEQLMRDAIDALPRTFVSPLWGMTECGGVTTCPFDAPRDKLFTTDGAPCGGMELKVVDAEGRTLPAGTDGELMARGPMVTKGYFRRPDLTAEYYLPDGFFRTGDLARMDADGYIKITGRIKDLIIRGGVNIAPAEIESVLFAHPSVDNVAVVGMPDDRLGERICAYVILHPGTALDVAEIQRWMEKSGVAKQKWPERVEIVDAFPMTPSGKVQKFRLRAMIAETLKGGQTVAARAAGEK